MRVIRVLAGSVVALAALNTSVASAQATRGFKDSWFWGLKGGGMLYQIFRDTLPTAATFNNCRTCVAPLAGFDWMITRTTGGLYLSFDHSFVSKQKIVVNDSVSPLDDSDGDGKADGRVITLGAMRRFTMAGLLFPMQTYRLHPYLGFGASLTHITSVVPDLTNPYRNTAQKDLVEGQMTAHRTSFSPMGMVGAQFRLPLASLFLQAIVTPANKDFFYTTGSGFRTSLEAGLRFNAGTSIDTMH